MASSIKAPIKVILISTAMALLLYSCEMKEETQLQPEIIITSPENNIDVIRGSTIKIKAQLKDFSQYYQVHRIALKSGDSTFMEKEGYVSHFSHLLHTGHLTEEATREISAQVWYTDEKPKNKNWNYFSVRDQYDKFIEKEDQNGTDTLQAKTSVTINLTEPTGNNIAMDFASFPPDTMIVEKDTLIVDSMEVGKYEVTNQQYTKFLNSIQADSTGSYGGVKYIFISGLTGISYNGKNFITREGWELLPVVNVTWLGANSFCQWMGGRLPTETEWYYASKPYYPYGGNNYPLEDVAWYKENSNEQLHAVGLKIPNTYGIHDMSGNAAEWCLNWYNASTKVYKGGHWQSPASDLNTSGRAHLPPDKAGNYLGFRVVIPKEGN